MSGNRGEIVVRKKMGENIVLCTKFVTTHFTIIEGPRVLKFKGV